jgi:hypothetical protein
MKFFRESKFLNKSGRFRERSSIVGSFTQFSKDIFRDKVWSPHEEMIECINMYNSNSFTQSALNSMKDFIKGGDIIVRSDDEYSKDAITQYLTNLNMDFIIDELIENTIKTGNGYLELNWATDDFSVLNAIYPIADSSRIYINCNEFGDPTTIKEIIRDEKTGETKLIERENYEEYYLQRVDPVYTMPNVKQYSLNYNYSRIYNQLQIYAIPINKNNILHVKLNIGDTGIYGRSYAASSLNDYEVLKQIERSIAIIAKHKAVPRDILMYGDQDNPATNDELDEFIIYLESLEKDESAIVNKPIKRESLSYNGHEINLEYMIHHIRKKLTTGIAPDFMMGMADSNKASSQITMIAYVLSIYSKRKLFLDPINRFIIEPYRKKFGLKKVWIEFGELDFETKSEKTNRLGSLWVQNVLTLNEVRTLLSLPKIKDGGDVFYAEHVAAMGMNGAPGQLSNNESVDDVYNHNKAPEKTPISKGGKTSLDPHKYSNNEPKLVKKTKTEK